MAMRKEVIPAGMESAGPEYGFAPARIANGMLYVAGQIGIDSQGKIPASEQEQVKLAFSSLESILAEVGCSFKDIVSMQTFHVGDCTKVNEWFLPLKKDFFSAPYPAWTSVGVSSLALPGALFEINVIAELPDTSD